MSTPWTPGPWPIERQNDTGPNDEGFWEWLDVGPARVDLPYMGDETQWQANARLIAAAPEMAAVLERMTAPFAKWDDGALPQALALLARIKGEAP
jgi:hypothetical protein